MGAVFKRKGIGFEKGFAQLRKRVELSLESEVKKLRKEIRLWFRLAIMDRWKPPSPEYDEAGREKPQPNYILSPIEYLKLIDIQYIPSPNPTLTVGIKQGTHKPSGRSYEELIQLREYGSYELNIPPAPVFRFLRNRIRSRLARFSANLKDYSV